MKFSDYILLRFTRDHAGRQKHDVQYVLRQFASQYILESAAVEVKAPAPKPKPIASSEPTRLMRIAGGKTIRVKGNGPLSQELIALMYGKTCGGKAYSQGRPEIYKVTT